MGFCTKCGRPLQDGEVCTCQQTAQPQMSTPQPQMSAPQPQPGAAQPQFAPAQPGIGADIAALYKGIFTSPVDTITQFMAKASIVLVAILIGAQAVMNALVRLFGMLVTNSKSKNASSLSDLEDILSSYYSSSSTSKKAVYSTGDMFKNMFLEILLVVVMAAVVALVVWLLVRAFDKTNVTYIHGLAAYSVVTLLGIPAEFLSWVLALTSVKFIDEIASLVSVFSTVAGYAFIYIAIKAICKNEKNVPLIMAVSIVCGTFAKWIVGLMF